MASISWTDDEGVALLTNGVPAPGDRFRGWLPMSRPVGAMDTSLGTGRRYMFAFRYDRMASFTLEQIPMAELDLVVRLISHLESGGTCTVTTGDTANRVYLTCGLAEGAEPQLTQQDAANLTYALSLTLVNLGNTDPMLCDYTDE